MTVTIYHNPACGTSRNTLEMIRQSGEDAQVIEYLKDPPSREVLAELLDLMGLKPRDILREKGTPYAELGLADETLSDDVLLDAMMAHPIHLHGHFFELVNGAPEGFQPQKHTVIVQPGGFAQFDLTADEPGDWAFHCHLLYHMHSGMFQVVTVAQPGAAAGAEG